MAAKGLRIVEFYCPEIGQSVQISGQNMFKYITTCHCHLQECDMVGNLAPGLPGFQVKYDFSNAVAFHHNKLCQSLVMNGLSITHQMLMQFIIAMCY